jgi:uncharacterized protein
MAMIETAAHIARELAVKEHAVRAVLGLLREGSTVPFIARYRKEATGGLDEVQIRAVRDRHEYLKHLEDRRKTVLEEVARQGKLSDQLRQRIASANTKSALEDIYAPYKPKRRTRAVIAKGRGLGPLAERIWQQPRDGSPRGEARAFLNKEVESVDDALTGARDICAERIADSTNNRRLVRELLGKHGHIEVKKARAKRKERTKFDDYTDYRETIGRIASHRYLAVRRGENEGILKVALRLEDDARLRDRIERDCRVDGRSPWRDELRGAANDALDRLLMPRAASDTHSELKERAERDAVEVFAKNMRQLLLAAPFGARAALGIDPGQRTGCKCAMVSATGKLLAHDTIYLVQGDNKLDAARGVIRELCRKHGVAVVAVGNGTHGRETERFVREVLKDAAMDVMVVSVSEAGASVYSASDVAREEFPNLDISIRGAVSIARRLQDPLAELVKIDPKSIGVGQYQHDVHQPLLAAKLEEVVEDCVNGVGVELNTASAPLLAHVAGLGRTLAKKIVAHRDAHGPFDSRRQLLKVGGLGAKTFEQAAGFLRIRGAKHPLDASAVHPERYALVATMAKDISVPMHELIGNDNAVARIERKRYIEGDAGAFTIDDILAELVKPGRDPRASFEPPKFREDVRSLDDLRDGMQLEGVVTNVTDFGAFVDIGVKQDGLVHISKLADHYVKHPSDVVAVGDKLSVRVLDVDLQRKRISLSAREG